MTILGKHSSVDEDSAILVFRDFDGLSDTTVTIDDDIVRIIHSENLCDITLTGKDVAVIRIEDIKEIEYWERLYLDERHSFPGYLKIMTPDRTDLLYFNDKTESVVRAITEYIKKYIELGETEIKL